MCSSPDRAVRVRALAGDMVEICALCSWAAYTLLSQCLLSPPRCIKGTGELNAGGNPAMD